VKPWRQQCSAFRNRLSRNYKSFLCRLLPGDKDAQRFLQEKAKRNTKKSASNRSSNELEKCITSSSSSTALELESDEESVAIELESDEESVATGAEGQSNTGPGKQSPTAAAEGQSITGTGAEGQSNTGPGKQSPTAAAEGQSITGTGKQSPHNNISRYNYRSGNKVRYDVTY
jgi:hypothetical protein